MQETRLLMDMPITVDLADPQASMADIDKVFDYFVYIDNTFSIFKPDSEISRLNRGELELSQTSFDMQTIFSLAEETKQQTAGYFDIRTPKGIFDPSGIVKGWAIYQAALLLKKLGQNNFFVEAGGDIQIFGQKAENRPWTIGIRNPFNQQEIVKVLNLKNNEGVATSGTYLRGQHIYNPHDQKAELTEIVSLTVIGPNIYEADRFATAAFAMGNQGINFIEQLPGFEGYQIDKQGQALATPGFIKYVSE